MEDVKSMIMALKPNQIAAIQEAHSYTLSQFEILALVAWYLADLRDGRVDIKVHVNTSLLLEKGFNIRGDIILHIANEFKNKSLESKRILYALGKNYFRGTAHPIYEICRDPQVKKLISALCFDDDNHFNSFHNCVSIIRHFLSHNYSEKVVLRKWDLSDDNTVSTLKKSYDKISFQYYPHKYFPKAYPDNHFKIDIMFDLSHLVIGTSLFNAISIKELLFMGEVCNNALIRTIEEIRKSGK